MMIPTRTFLLSLALMPILGCSSNLDSECAEFYNEVNSALDVIISTRSEEERSKLVENLNAFESEFSALKKKVDSRYDEKAESGKLYSEFVFDDLTQRKAVALNGFIDRRGKIKNRSEILDDMFTLSMGCNHTLR